MATNPFSLQGRVALVTGGNSGIGRTLAVALREAGAKVAIGGRRADRNAAVLGELGDQGAAFELDVCDEASVERAINGVVERFGRIDILINNAGDVNRKSVMELERSDWDRVMAINLTGPFLCTKHAARRMKAQGSGKIINIASVYGLTAPSKGLQVAYTASKTGVIGLTRVNAVELMPLGIQVNAIAPGYFFTEMTGELRGTLAGTGYQAAYAVRAPGRDLGAGRHLHLPGVLGLRPRQRDLHPGRRRVSGLGRSGTRLESGPAVHRRETRLRSLLGLQQARQQQVVELVCVFDLRNVADVLHDAQLRARRDPGEPFTLSQRCNGIEVTPDYEHRHRQRSIGRGVFARSSLRRREQRGQPSTDRSRAALDVERTLVHRDALVRRGCGVRDEGLQQLAGEHRIGEESSDQGVAQRRRLRATLHRRRRRLLPRITHTQRGIHQHQCAHSFRCEKRCFHRRAAAERVTHQDSPIDSQAIEHSDDALALLPACRTLRVTGRSE